MLRQCSEEDRYIGDGKNRCGMIFDDVERSTICPHQFIPRRRDQGMSAGKPNYVYVASSWRNPLQVAVCRALTVSGIDCYDFRNPTEDTHGFHWSEVMPNFNEDEQLADADEYIEALKHEVADEGFHRDFDAMKRADACVLVLPCNRSAHLELGWMVGQGKRTAIMLDVNPDTNQVTPELMYKMVDYIAPSLFDLLGWLGVED